MPDVELHRRVATQAGYVLGEKKGEGGFKICYAATDASGNVVAFKVVKSNAKLVVDRTLRELMAMKRCNHPNIARCINSGIETVGDRPFQYVVEEFFTGGSLQDRVTSGVLKRNDVLTIGRCMIEAVAYLRDHRLVHRDIKPPNIMFNLHQPVLTDFGIVRALDDQSLTTTGQFYGCGTVTYMPAEQLFNQKPMIDWRSDQFALGVTLSLAAVKQHPFGESVSEQCDSIAKRLQPTEKFKSLAVGAGFPALVRMLQPFPIQRYQTPAQMYEDWQAQGG